MLVNLNWVLLSYRTKYVFTNQLRLFLVSTVEAKIFKFCCYFVIGLITHWRTAPAHRRNDGVKLVGCDICDAFNIVNGFRDEEAVELHTKYVHGEVSQHLFELELHSASYQRENLSSLMPLTHLA